MFSIVRTCTCRPSFRIIDIALFLEAILCIRTPFDFDFEEIPAFPVITLRFTLILDFSLVLSNTNSSRLGVGCSDDLNVSRQDLPPTCRS
jgi:hypothetical protein